MQTTLPCGDNKIVWSFVEFCGISKKSRFEFRGNHCTSEGIHESDVNITPSVIQGERNWVFVSNETFKRFLKGALSVHQTLKVKNGEKQEEGGRISKIDARPKRKIKLKWPLDTKGHQIPFRKWSSILLLRNQRSSALMGRVTSHTVEDEVSDSLSGDSSFRIPILFSGTFSNPAFQPWEKHCRKLLRSTQGFCICIFCFTTIRNDEKIPVLRYRHLPLSERYQNQFSRWNFFPFHLAANWGSLSVKQLLKITVESTTSKASTSVLWVLVNFTAQTPVDTVAVLMSALLWELLSHEHLQLSCSFELTVLFLVYLGACGLFLL